MDTRCYGRRSRVRVRGRSLPRLPPRHSERAVTSRPPAPRATARRPAFGRPGDTCTAAFPGWAHRRCGRARPARAAAAQVAQAYMPAAAARRWATATSAKPPGRSWRSGQSEQVANRRMPTSRCDARRRRPP